MISTYVSNANLDAISSSFNMGVQTVEDNLAAMAEKLGREANPSQQDLMAMQTLTIKYQALLQSQSSTIKVLGDTMKAIVNNIGG